MSNNWKKRASDILIPLSASDDLHTALKEWLYTGVMNDLGSAEEKCDLCGYEPLRYQFEIKNQRNANSMLIGSECIKRFEINALGADGDILAGKAARTKVDRDRRKLIAQARWDEAIATLERLAKADTEIDIWSMIAYYTNREAFTPKQMGLVIWQFKEHGIPWAPRNFKIILRRGREREQVYAMEDWKLRAIWPVLSSSQQETVFLERNAHGHLMEWSDWFDR